MNAQPQKKKKSKCKTNRKLRKQAQRRERVNGVRTGIEEKKKWKKKTQERKSERSENGKRMEMGKEEMERTRTGHVEGGASIMGRGKGKKQNRAGHVD